MNKCCRGCYRWEHFRKKCWYWWDLKKECVNFVKGQYEFDEAESMIRR